MAGLHINSLLWEHEEYIGRVRPGVNLLLNPKVEQALILKGRSPESKLIGRVTIPPGDGVVHSWFLSPGTVDGAKAAGKRAAEYCMAQGVPQCDAWIITNEPPVELLDHIRLLAEFDSEFARAMHRAGKRACIGTFSRGTPQIPQEDGGAALSTYAPALRVAHEVGAWLVFHSYGKYPLFHDADFLALRWQRKILPWYRAQGVPIPRYVITEAGVDRGTGIDAQNQDGWRNTPYKDDIAAYGRDLLALMQEYAKDPACLGATIFCAGRAGWESFVVDGPLLDHLATLSWPKFGVAAPIPAPTPVPQFPAPQPTPSPTPPKESDNVELPSWVKVEKAQGEPGQNVWRLARAAYLPPEGEGEPNSQGRHHIEIMEPHDPSRRVAIHNKQTGELWTLPLDKPRNEPAQNHPMYGEPNNYSAYMTGAPSDVVSELVMKGNRHVTYQLWFELVKVPETTPTPQPEVPVPDKLVQILQRIMGDRFEDVRAKMPYGTDDKGKPVFFGYADSTKMPIIALHYSASAAGPTTPYGIAKFHTDKPPAGRGWPGGGYHFVIDEGRAFYVGDVNTQRAHVANRNDEALGICITGTYEDSLPSPRDINALRMLIAGLDEFYGHKKKLMGHNQVLPGHTLCPGRIVELIPTLRTAEPPKPTGPNYGKVVWALEQAARNLQAEGLRAEHDYIVKTVLPPIVKMRDGG